MNHAMKCPPRPFLAQHSPAAQRNGPVILQVLQEVLPRSGLALEVASGTGQHVALFAAGLPQWTWQPSDAQTDAFASIVQWCQQADVTNVREPLVINVLSPHWPSRAHEFRTRFDAIFCANMLHISPWSTCAALMQGASRYLAPQGVLITYGPYLEPNVLTSGGNLDFDKSLRERNPAWGIRLLGDVLVQAELAGLQLHERREMPANNLLLEFRLAAQRTKHGDDSLSRSASFRPGPSG